MQTHTKHQAKTGTNALDLDILQTRSTSLGVQPSRDVFVAYCYVPHSTLVKVSFVMKGESGSGNRRSGSLPSLAMGPWETDAPLRMTQISRSLKDLTRS